MLVRFLRHGLDINSASLNEEQAAGLLGDMGPTARDAIPVLRYYSGEEGGEQPWADAALRRIDPGSPR